MRGNRNIPDLIALASLLKAYHISYEQYLDTPEPLSEAMQAKLMVDARLQQEEIKKLPK